MDPLYAIIVPTYKESKNLRSLTERVFHALSLAHYSKKSVEMLVIDDNSQDGSQDIVKELENEGFPIRIITRVNQRGLSSAVIRGFDEAQPSCKYFIVMDADLQHPPEKIPEFFRMFIESDVEFIIGTRYGSINSVDKDWPLHRRIISMGARSLAYLLSSLSDPMSGFFGISRVAYQHALNAGVNSIGYKIALELFVKAKIVKHGEVPIFFSARVEGESKLSQKVIFHYIFHLISLYQYKFPHLLTLLIVFFICIMYVVLFKIN